MKRESLFAWLVTAKDAHGQEMPQAHDKTLAYLTGLDVTAGSLVVTLSHAAFFTDSRYVIAAKKALSAYDITVINSQMAGSQAVPDFICKHLGSGEILGFDGRTIPIRTWRRFYEIFSKKGISMVIDHDLVDVIWEDRPAIKVNRAFIYDGGKSCKEKLTTVRRNMLRQGAGTHVLTDLCDIAWLTNLRGSDQDYTPVFKSFMIIDQQRAVLYGNERAFSEEVLSYLHDEGVAFASYDSFCHDLKDLNGRYGAFG